MIEIKNGDFINPKYIARIRKRDYKTTDNPFAIEIILSSGYELYYLYATQFERDMFFNNLVKAAAQCYESKT